MSREISEEESDRIEEEVRSYLELECPEHLGSRMRSFESTGYAKVPIFEAFDSLVWLFDVRLENGENAMATYGGILYGISPNHPPLVNVFPRSQLADEYAAAERHLYWEGKNRFETFKNAPGGIEELAKVLHIPEEFR